MKIEEAIEYVMVLIIGIYNKNGNTYAMNRRQTESHEIVVGFY